MKQFTVKDFIAYNNPCFSCGDNIHINIVSCDDSAVQPSSLRPTVRPKYTTVNLHVTYQQTLQLQIIHDSNKFGSSNPEALKEYLKTHKLYLTSSCNKCLTQIETYFLEFNMNKGFILPVELNKESVILTDKRNRYHLLSSYSGSHTTIWIDKADNPNYLSPVKIEAPLMPLSKFKDREQLLNKLRTYLLFS